MDFLVVTVLPALLFSIPVALYLIAALRRPPAAPARREEPAGADLWSEWDQPFSAGRTLWGGPLHTVMAQNSEDLLENDDAALRGQHADSLAEHLDFPEYIPTPWSEPEASFRGLPHAGQAAFDASAEAIESFSDASSISGTDWNSWDSTSIGTDWSSSDSTSIGSDP